MKPKAWVTVIYSFLIGGILAVIAQTIAPVWTTLLTGTPMEFFKGGATLVSMGIIGCILGGFAHYQKMEEWGTFGCLLPFSGFAMAVGMKMVTPWTKGEKLGKSMWPGAWLVIWFNVVGAAVCILFGFIVTKAGVTPTAVIAPTQGSIIYFFAFILGGALCAFFQIVFLIVKCSPVWILLTAWMVGAILAPFGISGGLINWGGQGFSVMIPIGGYNMYNVGMAFAIGETAEGLVHLGSFLLAVAGLFLTGCATWAIYNKKFGRTPINVTFAAKSYGLAKYHGAFEENGTVKAEVVEATEKYIEQ